ncbi:MAG: response regulator [Candidatus Binatia bacterium]
MTTAAPANLDKLFPGNTEMARRMRDFDWSNSDLGPPESWPQNLRIAISICLTSRFPMHVWWGPALTLFYNDAYISFLGRGKHPAVLGRSGREAWSEIWDTIGPMIETVMTTGNASWSEDILMFFDRKLPKEEVYVTFSFSPVFGESNKVDGMFCACTETTEKLIGNRRLETLRKLGVEAAKARSIAETCKAAAEVLSENPHDIPSAAFYVVDEALATARLAATTVVSDGEWRLPESISLEEENSLSGLPLASVLRTKQAAECADLDLVGIRLSGGPWPESATTAIVLPLLAAGHEKLLGLMVAGVSSRRVLDDAYRDFFDLVAGHIVTAIANAQAYEAERTRVEALAEIDRAKTVFFSNISHEFRTPLTLILGPMEELLSGALGETTELQRAHLATLRRNAVRLQKLVNTLLDYARVEAGRIEATYEPVDIALLTRELASTFCSAVHRAGLIFVLNCPSLDEPIYVDRNMWEKIVLNLLSNALKFTFAGSIEASLISAGDRVAFAVRDTGVGIPEEDLPRLFERFHRVHGTRARTQEGSGIGLALVHELVRLHGGALEVESAPDIGTTFTVFIPKGSSHLPEERLSSPRTLGSTALGAAPFVEEALRWFADDERAKTSQLSISAPAVTPAPALLAPASERILVVDDNADMRNYLRRLLELHWHVETVEDGAKALAAAREQQPDLIITDVMMPGLGGFELLRELRADAQTRTVPLILLSARAGEEAYVEGMNAGADDYVVKPFGARELLARVKARLEIARVRREAEQRITNIWESITDGFQVIDNEWRLTYMNSEANRILAANGMDPGSVIGTHFWDEIFPEAAASDIALHLRRAMTERVPVTFESYYAPWRRWYSNRVYPLPDGGLANYFQDITVRKQAEEKLRESEERLRRAMQIETVGVIFFKTDGRITDTNDAFLRMSGYSRDDFEQGLVRWDEMTPPEWMPHSLKAVDELKSTGRTVPYEKEYIRKDGSRWWALCAATQLAIDEGVEFIIDITETKQADEALKEASRHKDEFLANMSHEIRSPMTGIMGYADILLMKLQDPDNIECVKTIKESGNYLLEIIDDILDLSKIEAGKLKLHKESVPLTALLAETHTLMAVRAKGKKLPLILRYDGAVPETIETDRTRLRQILVNLVSNAIKFTEQGSVQMIVRFLAETDLLQIDVVDTGIGISPAQQRRLFQPFSQEDSSATREYGGTGLGLAITGRLVEMLGGYISFDSKVGKGTAFHVIIPIGPIRGATVLPIGIGSRERMETTPALNCRVLVVDDRAEIRYLISHFVREAGGRATGVADGQTAIEEIKESDQDGDLFDLVIMDIQMPGMDGYQVTRRLRAEGFKKPIIALTAGAMKGDREKCLQAGCDDYLSKPIDRHALVQLVAHYAHKSGRSSNTEEGKLKILLVDDSPTACRSTGLLLEIQGHDVRTAANGHSALAIARQFHPDVVLLDINLPDMNGYELMKCLKEIDDFGGARFIALTGYGEEDVPRQGTIEFDHFLQKPLNMTHLDALLRAKSYAAAPSP